MNNPSLFATLVKKLPLLARNASISFVSAVIVAVSLYLCGWWPTEALESAATPKESLSVNFFTIVLLAPAVETGILLALIKFLQLFCGKPWSTSVAALVLAGLHAIKWWGVALIAAIPFLVFASPFREPGNSDKSAALQSMAMHAIHNTFALATLMIGAAL